ncbi:peptidoglycan recognition family protein [Enterocloster citroniae]|uniref:peptidoglycan recognition family protein n=2 Tax=Enterocloster citroniae TaxID=358743 RepID=UPI001FA8F8EA|nr:peptidoglycan recognition family protein [Enterocloster citroniae]MCD8277972.1 N-acetylmuramoyl-L-alanine amidase [Enterocloster citroniae]
MKGIRQMREDYTKDMEIGDDIRHVPLEPGKSQGTRQNRPVGASHMGGTRQDNGAEGALVPGHSRAKGAGRSRSREEAALRKRAGSGNASAAGEDHSAGGGHRTGESLRTGEGHHAEKGHIAQIRADAGSRSSRGAGSRLARSGSRDETRSNLQGETRSGSHGETRNRSQREGKNDSRGSGKRRGVPVLALLLAFVLGIGAGFGGGYYLWGWERPYTVDLKAAEVPEWVKQDFIRKNIFSRPDVSRQRVNNIVIHYVANPGSTAENNRNYFDSLADQDPQKGGTSTSSHFVVGLEGEVIQCIPITEIAYANAPRNDDTIAIEVCHPDETGKFNDATYESVVNLTAALCKELKLTSKDVVRHYDINGKVCPKYFVDHEDAWEQFKKDVDAAMKGSK